MTGTLASRAFLMRFAIFGSDETQEGRGSQTVLVMSSTRSAAPFTGTSTATAAGMVGIAEVGAGVGDALVIGKIDVDAVDGEGAAAGWVQPANVNMRTSGSASLFMTSLQRSGGMVLPNVRAASAPGLRLRPPR